VSVCGVQYAFFSTPLPPHPHTPTRAGAANRRKGDEIAEGGFIGMAYYPGICMIEIERVRTAEKRFGNRFLERLFTPAELSYCGAGAARHQRLACRIAAKVAVRSALRQAGLSQLAWLALEVKRDDWGKPSINLTRVRERCTNRPVPCSLSLSLSHSRDLAVASAIIAREKTPLTVSPRRHGVDYG